MKSANAIVIEYQPSRGLVGAVLVATVLALVAIAFSAIPSWATFALALCVGGYAGFAVMRFLRSPIKRAALQPGGHWRVVDCDGREFSAELVHGIARGAWIVLKLRRSDGKNLALILAPDNCDTDSRRRLRVRLANLQGVTDSGNLRVRAASASKPPAP